MKRWAIGLLSAGLSLGAVGFTSADDKAKDGKTEEKKDDAIKVPDGTPEELMAFIAKQMSGRGGGFDLKNINAISAAADKIAANSKATDAEKDKARAAKLQALFTATQMDPSQSKTFEAYRGEVVKAFPNTDSASLAEGYGLVQKYFTKPGGVPESAGEELMAFAVKYPKSDIGLQLNYVFMSQNSEMDNKKALQQAEKLAEIYKGNRQASMFKGLIASLKMVGKPIEIAGPTITGSNFDIASLKGKVVIVDFWATWCRPCVAALPGLQEVYKEYNSKGLEVVAISLDRSQEPLDKFVKDKSIPWTQIYFKQQPNPLAMKYEIDAIPAMFLVGRDGKVVAKLNAHEKEKLAKAVADELAKNSKPAS